MRPCAGPIAALFLVGLVVGGCTSGTGSVEMTVPPATTTTMTAATTSTVATTTSTASGPSMVASFDGETCTYDGPEQVSVGEIVALSFTNRSALKAGLFVTAYTSEDLEEIRPLIGSDIEPDSLSGSSRSIVAELLIDPGETTEQDHLLPPGTLVIDCQTRMPEVHGPAHLWLVGILEVGE
jgi:hypothetical protein